MDERTTDSGVSSEEATDTVTAPAETAPAVAIEDLDAFISKLADRTATLDDCKKALPKTWFDAHSIYLRDKRVYIRLMRLVFGFDLSNYDQSGIPSTDKLFFPAVAKSSCKHCYGTAFYGWRRSKVTGIGDTRIVCTCVTKTLSKLVDNLVPDEEAIDAELKKFEVAESRTNPPAQASDMALDTPSE